MYEKSNNDISNNSSNFSINNFDNKFICQRNYKETNNK